MAQVHFGPRDASGQTRATVSGNAFISWRARPLIGVTWILVTYQVYLVTFHRNYPMIWFSNAKLVEIHTKQS